MKRFYCTICQRVKRVRKYPLLTSNVDSQNPTLRTGVCTRHTESPAAYAQFKRRNMVGVKAVK